MSHGFSVESRLIHAGTDHTPGEPAADLITDIDRALDTLEVP